MKYLALLIAISSALVLGCSNSGQGDTSSTTAPEASNAPATPPQDPAPAIAAGGPAPGKEDVPTPMAAPNSPGNEEPLTGK